MIWDISYCSSKFAYLLNIFSNLFYILTALFILKIFKDNKIKDTKSKIFLALVFLIGIGSFIWHIYSSKFTFFFDSIPIAIFFVFFLYNLIYKISNKRISIIVTILFVVLAGLSTLLFQKFNGAQGYIFVLLFFIVVMIFVFFKNRILFNRLIIIFLLFLTAIIFRQMDLYVCRYFVLGTHFIWHIITSFAIYLLIKSLY